jgi:hypothetical protein
MNDVYQTIIIIGQKQNCEFFNLTLDGVVETVLYELLERHAIYADPLVNLTKQEVIDKVLDEYGRPSTHTKINFNGEYMVVETWLRYVGN